MRFRVKVAQLGLGPWDQVGKIRNCELRRLSALPQEPFFNRPEIADERLADDRIRLLRADINFRPIRIVAVA